MLIDGNNFPNLQSIDLNNNQMKDEGLKALALNGNKFPSLR